MAIICGTVGYKVSDESEGGSKICGEKGCYSPQDLRFLMEECGE